MDIEQVMATTGVVISYNAESGKIAYEGTSHDQVQRARAMVNEDAVAAKKQLRAKMGLEAEEKVKVEETLGWSADDQVSRQRRFMAQHGEYHRWSDEQLDKLKAFLHDGDEVVPTYAFSLFIKRGGQELQYDKVRGVIE